MSEEWVLWLFEGVVIGAALMILFSRSVFYAGLNLLVVVLSTGVIFGLYGSEFLFISQVMVYGGGILVLILFATMVTKTPSDGEHTHFHRKRVGDDMKLGFSLPILLAASGVMVIITVWVIAYQPRGVPYVISTAHLGHELILDYSLPLEISGVLLLVSLIGATLSSIQKPTER